MIENMIRNFRALWRAESIIADLHFRQLLSRLMLKAFAGLIAVFGLLMLNVSAFFAASGRQHLSPFSISLWLALLWPSPHGIRNPVNSLSLWRFVRRLFKVSNRMPV
jgi:hypothetical protein